MNQKLKTLQDDVFLRKEGVVKKYTNPDGDVTLVKVAEPCKVESSIENIDTGEVSVKLKYKTVAETAKIRTLVTPAEMIASTNKIEVLANKGLDVNGENKKFLISYLRKSRGKAPYGYQHNKVGFSQYHNQLIFKHQKSIGLQNIEGIEEESQYVGPLNIKPVGSYDHWLETINDYVLGNPALELALILGLSAPVIGYIGDQLGIESLFFHIYGNSSSGKTTACFIATASFGSPNTREGGLIQSWNTTMNALQATIADNRGLPMVFDECSMSNVSDYTNLIYSIGEGREKARMGADLELRKSRTWMTAILSTGEMSLLEKANKNIGLKARLIVFDNVQWTSSAEQSEQIKRELSKNYGYAGIVFVEHLLSLGQGAVIDLVEKQRNEATQLLPKSQITERLAMKVGILFATIELCEQCFKLKLQKGDLKKLIIEHVCKNIDQSDIASQAYQDIMQYVTVNKVYFEKRVKNKKFQSLQQSCGNQQYGYLEIGGRQEPELIEVVIITQKCQEILTKEFGYESWSVIISEFKKRGWLDCEKGKTYRKRKVNGITNQVYVIKVPIANAELGLNSIDVEEKSTFQLNDNEPDLFDGIELDNLTSPEDDSDDLSDFEIF